MVLGDGIRRNISKVDETERKILLDAIIAMHEQFHFEGKKNDEIPGGVSYWFKQDEIHQSTHVHHGPAFLPWHRELCNRFEDMLREYNKDISLHYWDWSYDPSAIPTGEGKPPVDLFNNYFGNAYRNVNGGLVGDPLLKHGFYDPTITNNNFRGDSDDEKHNNPFDPPKYLRRNKQRGTLESYMKKLFESGKIDKPFFTDEQIVGSSNYEEMWKKLEHVHDLSHSYIGGTIGDPHSAFRDPFVFLLHSNVDRLFATWQHQPGQEWRLNPENVYGSLISTIAKVDPTDSKEVIIGIQSELFPWNGSYDPDPDVQKRLRKVRPWAAPENKFERKNSTHPSVVIPRPYDTTVNIKRPSS